MDGQTNKAIEKIKKLLVLSGSDNENEAKSAMMKAQEIMAKYEIRKEQLQKGSSEKQQVIHVTSPAFRSDWIIMVANVVAGNFRCRSIVVVGREAGGVFQVRFYGYPEDVEICMNVFSYAIKSIRKRFVTLKAIYAEASRKFEKNAKTDYVIGFCSGLERGFDKQKTNSEDFSLAVVTPKAVNNFVDALLGVKKVEVFDYELDAENKLLRHTGYMDGKEFHRNGVV